ncbi:MAG: DUF4573 domain-containing protein [Reinekea sp.]
MACALDRYGVTDPGSTIYSIRELHMDRFNGNHPSTDYYSQAYQEYGQHPSQPEIGQTSGEVATSGSLWSYPAQGRPQPYPDSNFPQWIPPSPSLGEDLECLLRTPQPIPFENIIQNEVLPNAQPAVKPQRRSPAEIIEEFLAGLDKYAQGYRLKDCSTTINFFRYVTQDGDLQPLGRAMRSKLEQKDKDRVDRALADRKVSYSLRQYRDNSTWMRIREGLKTYASGAPLKDCSATIKFSIYFSSDSRLLPCGEKMYKGLNQEDKDRVDQALKDRKENGGKVRTSFLEGLDAYANGAALKDCSTTISFDAYVSIKGYLHERGHKLFERLEQGDKDRVNDALSARQKIYRERIAANDMPVDDFLEGLAAYASGVPLKDCSATIKFAFYVTSDGRLRDEGKRLYRKLVGGEGEALVNNALAARRRKVAEQISTDRPDFLKALEPYSNGLDIQTCGELSGLNKKAKTYFTPEGGLTAKGELLTENLPPDEQLEVLNKVGKRRQLMNPNAQAPNSPWLLPEMLSPTPEMGGMNSTAMTVPIQTEAMYDPIQTETMYYPMQTETVYDPIQTETMYGPMQTETMYDPMRTETMYDPIQTETMYGPIQTETMYDPMRTEAMYDPMQTETVYDPMQTDAMWATVWQLTGQGMPGPLASAEPPIPHYDSEAVGAYFQHPLWSVRADTQRTELPYQPGNRGPYADQYPWQGV